MELDIIAHPRALKESQAHAKEIEEAGFGSVWWTDSGRSAYLACTASALGTERLQIGTGIAVAFARSPMVTAGIAWELAAATNGRFVLGLGSQVKSHIERRYSAEFAPPGPRMKEYVQSVKAIFRAFRGEEKLMIGFYGSTRTYSAMFEHHGFDGLSDELYACQQRGDIKGMLALVTDEVLSHYIVTSSWNDLGPKLVERYRDLAPNVRVTSYTAAENWADPGAREKWAHVTKTMRDAN